MAFNLTKLNGSLNFLGLNIHIIKIIPHCFLSHHTSFPVFQFDKATSLPFIIN